MYSLPDIAEGPACSSTHCALRSNSGLAGQVVLGSLRGHRPSRHSPSHSAFEKHSQASPQAFDGQLPPRHVALEEEDVFRRISKLDSSASSFIQSRTLV
jgi:hypothetical protein